MPEDTTKDSTDNSESKHGKKKMSKKEKAKEKEKENAKDAEKKEPTDIEKEYLELLDLKTHLTEKLHKNPKSKILRNAIKECNSSIHKLIKNARAQNTKMYYDMTRVDKKKTNEIDYFKKKLSNKEQLKIMRDLKEINEHLNIEKPYRLSLLQSKMPAKFKAVAMHKLNMLRNMEPGDPEYHKVKNWVDTFMKIPFGTYKNLSISINDGIDVCSDFLEKSKKTLDDCVFGLDDAKLQIMQMLGQWISNPAALGTAIAIKGAMGTGKTTLVKEGISKILGREFAFIALGGASDSSFLEGHSYTYEGSTWGKIVQILIDSKCMNPVIYFDELDKISDTPKGQEIVGILTHLTDTSQNSQFHDKYFSEIDFDLSKCLFIFSYNDENLVNPILRDRMYRIQTKGYDSKEKTVITKNYLLPKIQEQVRFNAEDIIIPDDTIQYIVSSTKFTKSEEGVRNLKRCLEIIYTKLNLFRLMKTNNPMLKQQMQMEVEFPFTVLRKHVDILIKGDDYQNQSFLSLYV
jgi:ATP-dependent Lon protease